jgi:RNA polymerase sigma-70 factor (ECF subfamily)
MEAAVNPGDEHRLPPSQAGALYLEYSQQLMAFALGLLKHRELAREVVQVAFGKALEHAGSIPLEGRKAWLFKVARNEALAIRRREGVARRVWEDLAGDAEQSASNNESDQPFGELVQREQVELVRRAMTNLPAEQRQVVEQRIYEGRTFAEIAADADLPLGTVLTRMRLALGKLEQALKSTR